MVGSGDGARWMRRKQARTYDFSQLCQLDALLKSHVEREAHFGVGVVFPLMDGLGGA